MTFVWCGGIQEALCNEHWILPIAGPQSRTLRFRPLAVPLWASRPMRFRESSRCSSILNEVLGKIAERDPEDYRFDYQPRTRLGDTGGAV